MTTLPTRSAITSGTTTNAQQKTNLGDQRDFIADLLGTDSSDKAAARTTLGVAQVPGKNIVINGAFKINQRAVVSGVVLAAGEYGHDRWKAGASGCTYSYSTSNGLTTITITAGSLQQVVESLNVPDGVNTLIMSWAGTAQGKIAGGAYAGSGVSQSVNGGANCTIEFDTGTLTQVQLENNSVATPFEQRSYTSELALCLRYFFTENPTSAFASGQCNSATVITCHYKYPTPAPMRAAPTITTSGTIGTVVLQTAGNSPAAATLSTPTVGLNSCLMNFTIGGGATAGWGVTALGAGSWTINASSEL